MIAEFFSQKFLLFLYSLCLVKSIQILFKKQHVLAHFKNKDTFPKRNLTEVGKRIRFFAITPRIIDVKRVAFDLGMSNDTKSSLSFDSNYQQADKQGTSHVQQTIINNDFD